MPENTLINLVRTDTDDASFGYLVVMLDEELKGRYPDENEFFAQFNKPDGFLGVVVAYLDGEPVGCGAFRRFSDNEVEIKRMFVKPECRGRRIAGRLLAELETWGTELGFRAFVLETGVNQPEAIALYKRSGYEVIPNYGQYVGVVSSVCMRKTSAAVIPAVTS